MLEIKNLSISVVDKKILDNFNICINDGEVHTIMGKNGIGKSSLCHIIMNDNNYNVLNGSINYNGHNLLKCKTYEIARMGIMYISQSPVSIEGVSNAEMIRTALREINNEKVDIFKFNKEMESICKMLELDTSFIHRDINVGASGGERKKVELLHMGMLKPKFIILDELDSGLDVDALKVVCNFINDYHEKYNASILLITHHTNILKYIKTNFVHILDDGRIIKTGDESLASKLENEGFRANIISESDKHE